jgi:predicted nuclease of restriction endonuclease-like (RecB) superfamily
MQNTDNQYNILLSEAKQQILLARTQAVRQVNRELIQLYWLLGEMIAQRQEKEGWGKSIVERLSADLKKEFPNENGFSSQNLWFMRQFYLMYRHDANLYQLAREIPWMHNVMIMTKIKDEQMQEYYLRKTAELGWTRNVLLNQIKGDAYNHQQLQPQNHNFSQTLLPYLAEQAQESIKSEYNLAFLGLSQKIKEKEIENDLITHLKEFLMELGYGFTFMGNQFRVRLGDKDYFIDLLFFHRKLQCLIAIELKAGEFKPEYAGKMNFYLEILDSTAKMPHENPSIGMILCAEKDDLVVEYSLRNQNKPIGVAEYTLTTQLPKELQNSLPNPQDLKKLLKKKN